MLVPHPNEKQLSFFVNILPCCMENIAELRQNYQCIFD